MAMLAYNSDGTCQTVPAYDASATKTQVAASSILTLYRALDLSWVKASGDMYLAPHNRWLNTIWLLRIFEGDGVAFFNKAESPAYSDRCIHYGNVLEDVRDPMVVFNGHNHTRTLSNFGKFSSGNLIGVTDGVTLIAGDDPSVAPPNPPLPDPLPADVYGTTPIPARGQFLFDVAIDASVLHSTVSVLVKSLDNGIPFNFSIDAARAVLLQYLPDWKERPPKLKHSYKSGVFVSDHMLEQRTTAYEKADYAAGERFGDITWTIEYTYKTDGLEQCNKLYNRLARCRHRRTAVPFAFSPLVTSTDASGSTSVVPVNMGVYSHMGQMEVGGEICRFDISDPDFFETRNIVSLSSTTIEVDKPFSKEISSGLQVFYSIIFCTVKSVSRQNNSDTHQTISVVLESI